MSLKGKTVMITGASRGIGKAIGLRAAQDGAHVVILAKTAQPHPKLEGTIYTAAAEMEALGAQVLPLQVDIRFEEQVKEAVSQVVQRFGGIDILVNNASAISLTGTADTSMKTFDLMMDINARGSFLCAQCCLPHLLKASNPHILNLSPPLNMDPKWFYPHAAYTWSKYAMSIWVLGMSEELRKHGIGINALWPKTTIATAAIANVVGGQKMLARSRSPQIVADAAHIILCRDGRQCSGHFFVDEELLQQEGILDFSHYQMDPSQPLQQDFFLTPATG